MMIAWYPSKKALKEAIGTHPELTETSIFGPEYKSNGTFCVANRPHITGTGREFFASITMENDKLVKVS